MKKHGLVILSLQLLIQTTGLADTLVGQLKQAPNGSLELMTSQAIIPLTFSNGNQEEAMSLLNRAPYVEIRGQRTSDGTTNFDQVPTIASGDQVLEGQLEQSNQEYSIKGVKIVFGRTKKVGGTGFDEKSKKYFVGKDVRAVGTITNGIFTLESIVRADVFTSDPDPVVDQEVPDEFVESFNKNPVLFIEKLLSDSTPSPSQGSFRGTFFGDSAFRPEADAPVLLITASGGQGDSMGAVNGHFAVGLGHVGKDARIRSEIFNVYVTNEKEIIPGNVDFNDYFGHLISGQLNYRPTYTMAIYGISEDKILKVKSELDRFHPLFRDGHTKITADKNCATMSVQALAEIGFYGAQRNGHKDDPKYKTLSGVNGLPKKMSLLKTLNYLTETKRAEFMPGPAFISMLINLEYLNKNENLNIKRADFIFSGQTPSARAVGQPPTMSVSGNFEEQGIIGAELAKKKADATGKQIIKKLTKK